MISSKLSELAIESIEYYLEKKELLKLKSDLDEFTGYDLSQVILFKEGRLRGQSSNFGENIGCCNINLQEQIVINAVNAAFFDQAFPRLSYKELRDTRAEVLLLKHVDSLNMSRVTLLDAYLKAKKVIVARNGYRYSVENPVLSGYRKDSRSLLLKLAIKLGLKYTKLAKSGLVIDIFDIINQ